MGNVTFCNNELVIVAFDDKFQKDLTDIRVMREIRKMTKGAIVTEARGVWEGIEERSWVLDRSTFESLTPEFFLNQVCILRAPTDGKNEAYLQYPGAEPGVFDGARVTIGRLSEVDEVTAKSSAGYTYLPITGTYFVAS